MSDAVHVVALGARTPVGVTAEMVAASIRADIVRVAEHPFMVDASGNALACGLDAFLQGRARARQRVAELAKGAVDEVESKLASAAIDARRVPLFLSLPEPRPGFDAMDAQAVARDLATHRRDAPLTIIGEGHAGSVQAIEHARAQIRSGAFDLCIVVGADSYIDPVTVDWLESQQQIARDGVRGGFTPGEASAALALASSRWLAMGGFSSGALVRGVATARELRLPSSDEGVLGEGLTEAVSTAIGRLGATEHVDDVYCDINGQRSRSDDWSFVALRLGASFRDGTDYHTPAMACGDVGAASVCLCSVLAVRAWDRRYAKGKRALVTGSSNDGLRGALLLERTSR